MNPRKIGAMAILSATLCAGVGVRSVAAVAAESQPPICIIGRDGSVSHHMQAEAGRAVEGIVAALPAGTRLVSRWISADSYAPENGIVTSSAPRVTSPSDNPFDPRAKAAKARHARELGAWRRKVTAQIVSAPSPRTGRTDVCGFLVLAGERIASHGGPAVLVVLSDMQGNVDRHCKNLDGETLGGAAVVVAAFENRDPAHRRRTEKMLHGYGAGEVVFVDGDEVESTDFREMLGLAQTKVAGR